MTRIHTIIRTAAIPAGALAAATTGAHAGVPELADAEVFVELNDTDGDLGIHAKIDGDPWKILRISRPDGQRLFHLRLQRQLRRQGLTEIAFESAEPTFDEFPPGQFFNRFPEGTYEVSATTLDGVEITGEAEFSHVLAAPPDHIRVNGELVPEDCDEGPVPVVSSPVTVTWAPVFHSHPDIGASGPVVVELYEVVIESEDHVMKFEVPADVTELEIPAALIALSAEWKIEILVRTDTHNNTATESCFEVE